MEALLNLEKDLFLLSVVKHEQRPKTAHQKVAVFRLLSDTIELVKNLSGRELFQQVDLLPAKGSGKGSVCSVYRIQKQGVTIDIRNESEDLFTLGISGTTGKDFALYRNGRLVEARSHIPVESVAVSHLDRGDFLLKVNQREFIHFLVE
jgi:hypothetical protein